MTERFGKFVSRRSAAAVLLVVLALGACGPGNTFRTPVSTASLMPDEFRDYWYQGEAEITSYRLEQARYGEIHEGSAVTIFVTEDLSRSKQVKLDDPAAAGNDAVKVLKLNSIRKFDTGIYPYSTMTSVFTPVYDDPNPRALKITASIQEWCGQTFVQMNRQADGYRIEHYSYFESEGDGKQTLPDVLLEDDIWNQIRLRPGLLPQGRIDVLPSMLYQRFSHSEWQPQSAVATISPSAASDSLMEFRLKYDDIDRELMIRFRKDFPHQIEYWEERQVSGFGPDARILTTRATLKKRLIIDYWNRNKPGDEVFRERLELPAA